MTAPRLGEPTPRRRLTLTTAALTATVLGALGGAAPAPAAATTVALGPRVTMGPTVMMGPATTTAPPLPVPPAGRAATSLEDGTTYTPSNTCDPHLKPGVTMFAALVLATYPGTGTASGARRCLVESTVSEHTDGRAWDWSVSVSNVTQARQASSLLTWLLKTDAAGRRAANARRLGIMYIIWNKRIFGLYDVAGGWKAYACIGVTACHQDHLHLSFNWAGARGVTSYWTGRAGPVDHGPCQLPGRMFATPTNLARTTPCPTGGRLAATDPLVTALRSHPDTVLTATSTGTAVATIQRALGGVGASGTMTQTTCDEIITYQRRRHLPATGTVTRAMRADLVTTLTGGAAKL